VRSRKKGVPMPSTIPPPTLALALALERLKPISSIAVNRLAEHTSAAYTLRLPANTINRRKK
jgi:hypothetical protein